MKGTVERYLDRVIAVADIRDPEREKMIRNELNDHIQEKIQALIAEGYPEAEAILKALEDHGKPVVVGYRLRPWRWLDVRVRGTARGVIAIGPKACGVFAFGGMAIGVVAIGGVGIGLFSIGGLALGLLATWGGLAVGGIAYGGLALGVIAEGGMAVGVIASGASALGVWVPGAAQVWGSYFTWETVPELWKTVGRWLSFDPRSGQSRQAFIQAMMILNVVTMGLMLFGMGIPMWLTHRETKRVQEIDPTNAE